ncbi:hypothetical protein [Streptomyces wuyuanensis]|uniref:hypothetical protein n=1 Tax=Streptomyces wuyuanensis TaxID=1196353 RepID=UPI0034337D97
MTHTPAQELRAAADKLRQMRFPAAMTATSSTAALIGARLPLADWLDAQAAEPVAATHSSMCPDPACTINAALAVARAINGGPQ